jgi:hypothetical protein
MLGGRNATVAGYRCGGDCRQSRHRDCAEPRLLFPDKRRPASLIHSSEKCQELMQPSNSSYFVEEEGRVYLVNRGGRNLLAIYKWTGSAVSRVEPTPEDWPT